MPDDEQLEELKNLLEEMRADFAIGDCFSAEQRLNDALRLLTGESVSTAAYKNRCLSCGSECGADGYCESCDMNRQAHEALYPDDGRMSWDRDEDFMWFCENCGSYLDDDGDCRVCDFGW